MSSWRATLRAISLWAWFSVVGVSAVGGFKAPVDPWRIFLTVAILFASAELANLVDLLIRHLQGRLTDAKRGAPEDFK